MQSSWSGTRSSYGFWRPIPAIHLAATDGNTATTADPSWQPLRQDVVDPRVWLGIHFRTADTPGARMGQQLANWALDHYFRPVERHKR